jgi:acetylglutamate kinase
MMDEIQSEILRNKGIDVGEAERLLTEFKQIPPAQFAVIKIGGDCLEVLKGDLVEDLLFLYSLGLYPTIVHGGGKQIDQALEERGIKTEKIDGLRKTDERTLGILVEVLNGITKELVSSINARGGQAVSLNDKEIFFVKKHPKEELGFVGEVVRADTKPIREAIESKKIPVTWCVGYLGDQKYNVNADTAANILVEEIKPKKFIFLSKVGGVLDKENRIVPRMSVRDIDVMNEKKLVSEGMKLKLSEIKQLLLRMDSDFCIQISSPQNLLKELFSREGVGTYIEAGH